MLSSIARIAPDYYSISLLIYSCIMPTKITRNKSGTYRVSTPHGTKSKSTTKKKAEAQKRLLDAIDHGFKPDRMRKKDK